MSERLLTAAELAALLAMSPATIIDSAAAGKVPSFKLGTAVRFRENEVLAWREEHRRGPAPCTRLDSGMIAACVMEPRILWELYGPLSPPGRGLHPRAWRP
jgi:excisionase family DNA binding protein